MHQDETLNSSNALPLSPTSADLPQPPGDHPILHLTSTFQRTNQDNNIHELTAIDYLYNYSLANFEFFLYYRSDLHATH